MNSLTETPDDGGKNLITYLLTDQDLKVNEINEEYIPNDRKLNQFYAFDYDSPLKKEIKHIMSTPRHEKTSKKTLSKKKKYCECPFKYCDNILLLCNIKKHINLMHRYCAKCDKDHSIANLKKDCIVYQKMMERFWPARKIPSLDKLIIVNKSVI